uniref:C2H2-type domain-containing protein n=1 Tax=Strongyloides papillosus TaxID=174720 RepID=A0A0N5BVS6_STREA
MEDELDRRGCDEEKDRDLHPYNRRSENPEMKNRSTAILCLETWLEFLGSRSILKEILKLRFKMMEYLLRFLRHPLRPPDKFDNFFLHKLENILRIECDRLKFKYNANLPPPKKYQLEEYRNDYQGNYNYRFYDSNKHHNNKPYKRVSNIHDFEYNNSNNNSEWNSNNPTTADNNLFYQQPIQFEQAKQPGNHQDIRYQNSDIGKSSKYIIASGDYNYDYSQRDSLFSNMVEKNHEDDHFYLSNEEKTIEKPTVTYQVTIKTCNYDTNPNVHYSESNFNQTINQFQGKYKTTIEHKNFDQQQKNDDNTIKNKYCDNISQSENVRKSDIKQEDNKQNQKPIPILGRRIEVAELFGNNYCDQSSINSNVTNIYNANVSTANSDVKVQISVIGGQKTPTSPAVSHSKGNKRHLLNQYSFRNDMIPSVGSNKTQSQDESVSVKLNTEDEQIPEDPCVKKDSNNKVIDNQRKNNYRHFSHYKNKNTGAKTKDDFNVSNNDVNNRKESKNDAKKDEQKGPLFIGKSNNKNRFCNSKIKYINNQKPNSKK